LNKGHSKSSAPKLYLHLQPYSQNTVHKLSTVDFFAILIPLRCKCRKSYSAYFDKKETCHTQEKYSKKRRETVAFALGWRVESD
jgi:hypothetical protein